jgi:hypothetical protein
MQQLLIRTRMNVAFSLFAFRIRSILFILLVFSCIHFDENHLLLAHAFSPIDIQSSPALSCHHQRTKSNIDPMNKAVSTRACAAKVKDASRRSAARIGKTVLGGSKLQSLAVTGLIDPIPNAPEMLMKMTSYFASMVDPNVFRFYYQCLPTSGGMVHGHCPIRDLGSAWDATTLLDYHHSHHCKDSSAAQDVVVKSSLERLSKAIQSTIEAYSMNTRWNIWKDHDDQTCIALSSQLLQEPSNIAHSSFLILATMGAMRLQLLEDTKHQVPVEELVNGILSMQQNDSGAFAIHFGSSDIFRGIEFYPGEALLALLQVAAEWSGNHDSTMNLRARIINAAKCAFLFYSDFHSQGNIDPRYTSFFGNWQVQCFTKLFDIIIQNDQPNSLTYTTPAESSLTSSVVGQCSVEVTMDDVANYIFRLCDNIIDSRHWKLLDQRRYDTLSTVEIACGLEALAEGTRVAMDRIDRTRVQRYWHHVRNAVEFLALIQDQVGIGSVGYGGLGHGLGLYEQRLDVTGHAVNALVKLIHVQDHL